MSSNIRTLLEELYELEPSLREKEEYIIRIIENMQKNRPDIVINEEFKNELRTKLLAELSTTEKKTQKMGVSWNW